MDHLYKQIDIETAGPYLRAIGSAYSKFAKREKARNSLQKHFKKVKEEAMKKNVSERNLEKDFNKLSWKISAVLELEKDLLSFGKADHKTIIQLKNRLNEIENHYQKSEHEKKELIKHHKSKIDHMNNNLLKTQDKLDKFLHYHTERKHKVHKLEQKMKGTHHKKQNLKKYHAHLQTLERKHRKLKTSRKINKTQLKQIEARLHKARSHLKHIMATAC